MKIYDTFFRGRAYSDAKLVERAVRSARCGKPFGKKFYRWYAVSLVFSCGSTVAQDLCRRFDLDPDVMEW